MMERISVVQKPIEIKKSRTPISEFYFESVLSFINKFQVDGLSIALQRLGDHHYTVAFTNEDDTNPWCKS